MMRYGESDYDYMHYVMAESGIISYDAPIYDSITGEDDGRCIRKFTNTLSSLPKREEELLFEGVDLGRVYSFNIKVCSISTDFIDESLFSRWWYDMPVESLFCNVPNIHAKLSQPGVLELGDCESSSYTYAKGKSSAIDLYAGLRIEVSSKAPALCEYEGKE
jgi:hypothetical protein